MKAPRLMAWLPCSHLVARHQGDERSMSDEPKQKQRETSSESTWLGSSPARPGRKTLKETLKEALKETHSVLHRWSLISIKCYLFLDLLLNFETLAASSCRRLASDCGPRLPQRPTTIAIRLKRSLDVSCLRTSIHMHLLIIIRCNTYMYIYGTTPPGTYLSNKSTVICSVFVENRRSLHRLGNSKSCQCQSAWNLHRLNNFNSFWEYSASWAEARNKLKQMKLLSLCRFRSLLHLENLTFPSSCRFPAFQVSLDSWKGISVQDSIWDTQVHFCSVYYTQLWCESIANSRYSFAYPKVWILDCLHFMPSRFYFDASIWTGRFHNILLHKNYHHFHLLSRVICHSNYILLILVYQSHWRQFVQNHLFRFLFYWT